MRSFLYFHINTNNNNIHEYTNIYREYRVFILSKYIFNKMYNWIFAFVRLWSARGRLEVMWSEITREYLLLYHITPRSWTSRDNCDFLNRLHVDGEFCARTRVGSVASSNGRSSDNKCKNQIARDRWTFVNTDLRAYVVH